MANGILGKLALWAGPHAGGAAKSRPGGHTAAARGAGYDPSNGGAHRPITPYLGNHRGVVQAWPPGRVLATVRRAGEAFAMVRLYQPTKILGDGCGPGGNAGAHDHGTDRATRAYLVRRSIRWSLLFTENAAEKAGL